MWLLSITIMAMKFMRWGYNMKKFFLALSIISLLILSSCDDIKGVLEILPKFDKSLPNTVSGSYAYFESEEKKDKGEYTRLLTFNSKDETFTFVLSDENGVKTEKGKYKVQYNAYKITECNGTITFLFDDGRKKDSSFYWCASALSGPDYLMLDDGRKYLYW